MLNFLKNNRKNKEDAKFIRNLDIDYTINEKLYNEKTILGGGLFLNNRVFFGNIIVYLKKGIFTIKLLQMDILKEMEGFDYPKSYYLDVSFFDINEQLDIQTGKIKKDTPVSIKKILLHDKVSDGCSDTAIMKACSLDFFKKEFYPLAREKPINRWMIEVDEQQTFFRPKNKKRNYDQYLEYFVFQ